MNKMSSMTYKPKPQNTGLHSIHHSWKALKRDAQLKQRIAKGAIAQLEDVRQTGELRVWELDMPFLLRS